MVPIVNLYGLEPKQHPDNAPYSLSMACKYFTLTLSPLQAFLFQGGERVSEQMQHKPSTISLG